MGRPKNTPETIWKFIDKSGGDSACWPWTGCLNHKGYGVITINWKSELVHRIALESVIGKLDKGQCSLHRCDRPVCCNPSHLFAGTKGDNNKDASEKGRSASGDRNGSRTHPEKVPIGESSGSSKITENQVIEMRKIYATTKIKMRELASNFGISEGCAEKAVRGDTWQHVPNPYEGIEIQSRQAKLSEETVREIRQLRTTGMTVIAIAHKFGLFKFTCNDIIYRRTWKNLE